MLKMCLKIDVGVWNIVARLQGNVARFDGSVLGVPLEKSWNDAGATWHNAEDKIKYCTAICSIVARWVKTWHDSSGSGYYLRLHTSYFW